MIEQQENYVLSRTDNHINFIKNDTLLLMDSFAFNPVEHFQSTKFSYQLIKAGSRFQHKVKSLKKMVNCLEGDFYLLFQTYPQASEKVIQYHAYLSLEHFITQCL